MPLGKDYDGVWIDVRAVDLSDNVGEWNGWVYVTRSTGSDGPQIAKTAPPRPTFEIEPNLPNPFSAHTRIRFSLPADIRTSLKVYNSVGQLVRTLLDGGEAAGWHEVLWDGRDDKGKPLGAGIYFCRIETPKRSLTRKLIRLR